MQAWLDLGLPESPEELGDSPQAARYKRWWARQLQSFQAWEQSTDLDATTVIHIGDDDSEPCSSPPMTAPSSASPHSPLPGTSRTTQSSSWSPHCLRAAAAAQRVAVEPDCLRGAAQRVAVEDHIEDVLPEIPVRERTPPPPRRHKWGSCPKCGAATTPYIFQSGQRLCCNIVSAQKKPKPFKFKPENPYPKP